MHFLAGRLPDGLPVLCIHVRRTGAGTDAVRDVRPDIPDHKRYGERVANVVVMGTGEPMDNFDNLLKFIELLTDENGLNISQRNVTVSTCGIVPKMRELADKKLQITLALSLHASSQEKRLELMPIANKYEIHEVIGGMSLLF